MKNRSDIYRTFARYYDKLGWERFSHARADFILKFLQETGCMVKKVLDVACGTGTFCILLAEKAYQVTGIDLSREMLSMARRKIKKKQSNLVRFYHKDMRNFKLQQKFDLVTCNFDSLNHILSEKEVFSTFQSVFAHLAPKGIFIFDVNTILGLRNWRYQDINQTDTFLTLVHGVYDEDLKRATVFIDGFVKEKDEKYVRFQETISEQGYSVQTLWRLLGKAGFGKIEPIGTSKGKSRRELESSARILLCASK
ncbi:class I SAM-dependent methyltransferase [Candidatus Sumerlaeota bacterium]|nr:class I SAM-dependent methyltransferase [Candidatus Sumerlaeota bacterium]